MRKLVFAFMAGFLIHNGLLAQNSKANNTTIAKSIGHSIQIVLKPYQNTKVYIGTNYGRNRVLADSTLLNAQSEGVFESKTKLTPTPDVTSRTRCSISSAFLLKIYLPPAASENIFF